MKKFLLLILIAAAATMASSGSTTWNLQGVKYNVDTLYHAQIGPGTTQTTVTLSGAVNLTVYYTTTCLTNPEVNLKVIMSKNNLTSTATVANMPTLHGDNSNTYFAGVNSDYFSSGGSIGTTVVNNELYKSYKGTGWYAVGIDSAKILHSGAPYTTFRMVSPNGGQASIKAVNVARSSNELILYTWRKGTSTGTDNTGVEVGAVAVDAGGLKANGTTRMKVITAPQSKVGNMAIAPDSGFVLSGNGFTTTALSKMQVGEIFEVTPTIYFNNVVTNGITEMAGGCPMLLQSGKILETQGLLDHLSTRQPRTAIGYNAASDTVVLLVVDGREIGESAGVTSKDLAAMMLNLGCSEALNFDGGGSSTLYVKDLGVRNNPSDGTPRAVKQGLFLATPATGDNTIAKIRFADYVGKVAAGGTYKPVIYGYDAKDVLINTNVTGFTLSCPTEMGKTNGTTVTCGNVNGVYPLTATYGNLSASIPVTVGSGAGIATINADKAISIYPNPINAGENAKIATKGKAEISLYSISGQLLSSITADGGYAELPTQNLSKGIYIVKAEGQTLKLIIK
jgi:hypothetical protein